MFRLSFVPAAVENVHHPSRVSWVDMYRHTSIDPRMTGHAFVPDRGGVSVSSEIRGHRLRSGSTKFHIHILLRTPGRNRTCDLSLRRRTHYPLCNRGKLTLDPDSDNHRQGEYATTRQGMCDDMFPSVHPSGSRTWCRQHIAQTSRCPRHGLTTPSSSRIAAARREHQAQRQEPMTQARR